jgi:hypothetical protein
MRLHASPVRRSGSFRRIRVDVDVLERGGLRAEEAAAEGVVRVAADGADVLALELDAEPAHASHRLQVR